MNDPTPLPATETATGTDAGAGIPVPAATPSDPVALHVPAGPPSVLNESAETIEVTPDMASSAMASAVPEAVAHDALAGEPAGVFADGSAGVSADLPITADSARATITSALTPERILSDASPQSLTSIAAAMPLSARGSTEAMFAMGLDYWTLVHAIEDYAIFLLDSTGHVVSWNPGAYKLKGYTASEIIGEHFSRFYTDEAIGRGWPQYELQQASLTGRFEDEGWRVRKDGTMFWCNVVITAIRDAAGKLSGFAKITRDLTAQRQYLETLRQSEERFRLLVDNVKDYAIFMLDIDGFVVSWNEGAARIKGYTRTEIVGQHFSTFYPPEDVAAGKPARELAIAQRLGRVEDEGWRVRKDGTMFWANVNITAVYDEARQLRGFAKVTRDLTERRQREELERSGENMRRFLALLAHELRNPLAPVRNAVGVMQLEGGLSPRLERARDMIDRQVTHLTRLVDDLLDVGRITSGKVELRLAPTPIADVIERALEAARPFSDARGQQVAVTLADPAMRVQGDLTRLVQVVQNLLHNATKFSPTGARIDVRTYVRGGMAVIEVADTGCGLAVESLDTIFDMFVQEKCAQNAAQSSNESGLGIGLTLCKSLTEMHGGSIVASSPGLGFGSTFTLSLPLGEEKPSVTSSDSSAGNAASTGPLRVLLVDDNRDSADSLAMLLELKGHEIRVVYDGEQAVREAPGFAPHVAVIDLSMPGMDGFATIAALRTQPDMANTMYAAMTGYGQDSDRERTRDAGFDMHLVKPVELARFEELLDKVDAERKEKGIG